MSIQSRGLARFEGFTLDRARWQLRHGDEVLPLNRKTFDLLLYLLDHADRVVTKDELLQALWPDAFIEESNLTQQIFLLRKALGKHEPGKKIVETTPGRGYRFAVPVNHEAVPLSEQSLQAAALPPVLTTPQTTPSTEGNASEAGRAEAALTPAEVTRFEPSSYGHLPRELSRQRSATRLKTPWPLALTTAFVALLMVVFLALRWREPIPPSVSTYTRITHDGHAKALGGTDGARVYFTRPEKSRIAQISMSGKGEELMQLAIQDPWSGEVSPDGSTLLIISQAGGQGPASSLWTLQLVGGALHRLANAIACGWSPSGDKIVYASASGELFVMLHDGSAARRIASVGGNVRSIAWSPDGHLLRFSRDGILWQIAPDGSNLTQMLPGWGSTPSQWSGQWALDGTYFFVADGQLWSLDDSKGTNRVRKPAQLTYGPTVWDRPHPSPDGRRLLASGRTSRGELVRLNTATGHLQAFLSGISAEFVAFSPAGNSVAYVSYPEGTLWRANADGTNPIQLTEPPFYPKSICWSPDGSHLAFVDRTEANVSVIFTIAADGSGKPLRLIPSDREAETDPSWSPNGRLIAYSTSPNVGASARSTLRTFDLAAGTVAELPGSDNLLVPRWSPSGHTLAAMTLDAKSVKLLSLSTGKWSTLNTGAVAFPEWSHDSTWIYFVRWTADPALLRIRASDGRQQTLADLTGTQYTGTFTLWMGLDRTDMPMMLRDTGTDDIYALSLQRRQ